MNKTCTNCYEIKPLERFSPVNFPVYGMKKTHGMCKPCRAYILHQRNYQKQVAITPWQFLLCSDEFCRHLWKSKHIYKCPKCGAGSIAGKYYNE